MRCPQCQYALWNLKKPTCPECGRGFQLDEWDFAHTDAPIDIGLACNACGSRLPGRLPDLLPKACPACGAPVDRLGAMVVPGEAGGDVPLLVESESVLAFISRTATWAMFLAAAIGLLVPMFNAGSPRVSDNAGFFLIMLVVISAGLFGVWPRRSGRRLLVVVSLCALVFAAFMVSAHIHANSHGRRLMGLRMASMARGVAQSIAIYTQTPGAFPSDPQALIDRGYIPIDVYFPLENPPASLTWHALPDGWIMVGSFAIDWNPVSWQADPPVVTVIAHPKARLDGVYTGYSDAHTDFDMYARHHAAVPRWNADRSAQGLPPIPAAALPSIP